LTVKKRGGHWYFDFQIRGARYREAIPEARTKFQAEQAETKARDQVFQGTYGTSQLGNQGLCEFVSETYLPWAKANKRTWRNDEIIANQCDDQRHQRGFILEQTTPGIHPKAAALGGADQFMGGTSAQRERFSHVFPYLDKPEPKQLHRGHRARTENTEKKQRSYGR
jgi:hypothetical protein